MAGYTRQSTADIIPTATVRAAPLNAEYNAIRDAFSASGGHRHDGTAAEGDYVPLISDLDNYNKVVIDSTNNRVGVFVEVSAAAVEQVRFQDGAIVPVTTNDIDLGTSLLKFKDLYLEGTATIGNISLDGGTIDDTVIGGTTPAAATFTTMTATTVDINGGAIDGTTIGATTPAAADFTTMDASGNATVGGTFGVTGNTTIGGTLGVTGVTTLGTANITSVDLDSGAIDNTTIGAATPAAGTFTTLTANTSLTAATADINGGTIDGATIGATSHTTGKFTTLQSTGLATLASVDINGGAIDGTTIGASSAAAGSFTTVSTSGQATLATADINGGTIDGTTIGTTTPAAITGTTVTATSFVGPVTGAVTGNVTGNVTGDLTGDVTGNITSSGSSSFNNVTIDGTLNMNAGTTATITNLTSPTNTNDAATKGYVDTSISNLVDSAPGTLDTLNELAAALGDDPNFSTTITTSIATKLPLAGGTMTGAIAMSTNKITGLGDPTAAQDAMTKAYADATYLALSGGTMTGAIDMGSQKITTTYTPTNAADLTTKTYVDSILGSATAASASAAAAATSESNAATSETNAATSATNAATSETNTATLYDNFDDRYLGAKASAPTVDNDGDALITGALYFNTTTNIMNVYGTSGWQSAGSAVNGTSDRQTYTATSGQTVFAATYDTGYVDVYLNGVKLLAGTDFTATNGTSITLASGAAVNDIVDIVAYGTFVLADHYSKTQSDARYVEVAGDTMTGNLDITGTLTSDGLTVDGTALMSTTNELQFYTSAYGIRASTGLEIKTGDFTRFLNGTTERMRIDTSGNLLVGKTSTSSTTAGANIFGGLGSFVRDGNTPLSLNRRTNDGEIVSFAAQDSVVGSIGGYGGQLIIGTGNTALRFQNSIPAVIPRTPTDGASDGVFDLGDSNARFKDLYLSGIAYANYVGSSGDTDTIVAFDTANTVRVVTAGSEAMRITSGGQLLLGTTSGTAYYNSTSTYNLSAAIKTDNASEVAELGIINGNNNFGSTVDFLRTNSAGNDVRIANFGGYADSNTAGSEAGHLRFNVKGSSDSNIVEAMRIDSSGNVGINEQSPDTKLHVSNNQSATPIATIENTAHHEATIRFKSAHSADSDFRVGASISASNNFEIYSVNAATARLAIDSSGQVGINTTTPNNYYAKKFVIDIGSDVQNGMTIVSGTSASGMIAFADGTSGASAYRGYFDYSHASDTLGIGTGGSEALRITAGGALNLGTAGLPTSGNAGVSLQPAGNVHCGVAGTSATDVMRFDNPNGRIGSITVTGTSTSYNTSSDYRLKENVTDVTDGITRVKQLAPKRFNFIADPDTIVDGFIAHEVQDVIPEAISGAKDAMRDEEYEVTPAVEATFDEDGNVLTEAVDAVMGTRSVPDYQGIDQSKLVPLLTAALQEAIAKIETLETEMTSVKARLDALEAN